VPPKPENLDRAGSEVSCQLYGEWDNTWLGTTYPTRKTASASNKVPFETNGRRVYASPSSREGIISDGPGDYGVYFRNTTLGTLAKFTSGKYVEATTSTQGYVELVFATNVWENKDSNSEKFQGPDEWKVGSKMRLVLPPESPDCAKELKCWLNKFTPDLLLLVQQDLEIIALPAPDAKKPFKIQFSTPVLLTASIPGWKYASCHAMELSTLR
jgi:hypothetical protein